MGTKISALTATTTPAAADVFPLVQGGTTKQATFGNMMRNVPAGNAGAPGLAFTGDQDNGLFLVTTNVLGFSTAGTERGRISAAGGTKFSDDGTYSGSSSALHEFSQSAVDGDALVIRQKAAATPYGITLTFSGASPDDNTRWAFKFSDATTTRAFIYSDGDLQNHDNSYGAISDERLKRDIEDASLQSQYDDIKAMRLRKYRFITDVEANPEARPHIGVIAQELAEVSPGLVQLGADGMYGVQYSVLCMKAIGALQHVIQMVEAHGDRLAALEAA